MSHHSICGSEAAFVESEGEGDLSQKKLFGRISFFFGHAATERQFNAWFKAYYFHQTNRFGVLEALLSFSACLYLGLYAFFYEQRWVEVLIALCVVLALVIVKLVVFSRINIRNFSTAFGGFFFAAELAWSQWFYLSLYNQCMTHVNFLLLTGMLTQGLGLFPQLAVNVAAAAAFAAQYSLQPQLRQHEQVGFPPLLFLVASLMCCSVSFDYERRLRQEFRRNRVLRDKTEEMARANEQLRTEIEQMRGVRSAIDLSTPYEKILSKLDDVRQNLVVSCRDDDAEDVRGVIDMVLGYSRNMLKPDLLKQIEDGTLHVDPDTEDWLLSEIAAPRDQSFIANISSRDTKIPRVSFRRRSSTTHSKDLMPPLSPQDESALKAELANASDWDDFDVIKVDELSHHHPLFHVGHAVLRQHDLVTKFNLDIPRLSAFLNAIEQSYIDSNPYHNSIHAADVTQSMHFFVSRGGLHSFLRDIDILSALLAAIIHDLGHPGVTNAYEIATSTERAVIYNDRSVLENFHVSRCFMLLRNDKYDFLRNVSAADRKEIRKAVISMVLSTDLANHFDILGQFKARMSQVKDDNIGKSQDDRSVILNLAIKCADVSNPGKKLSIYLWWVDRIMAEFFRQGDEERAQGLPISPWMDRSLPQVTKCQLGFMDFLVFPMYSSWVSTFKESQPILDNIKFNRDYMQQKHDLWELQHDDPTLSLSNHTQLLPPTRRDRSIRRPNPTTELPHSNSTASSSSAPPWRLTPTQTAPNSSRKSKSVDADIPLPLGRKYSVGALAASNNQPASVHNMSPKARPNSTTTTTTSSTTTTTTQHSGTTPVPGRILARRPSCDSTNSGGQSREDTCSSTVASATATLTTTTTTTTTSTSDDPAERPREMISHRRGSGDMSAGVAGGLNLHVKRKMSLEGGLPGQVAVHSHSSAESSLTLNCTIENSSASPDPYSCTSSSLRPISSGPAASLGGAGTGPDSASGGGAGGRWRSDAYLPRNRSLKDPAGSAGSNYVGTTSGRRGSSGDGATLQLSVVTDQGNVNMNVNVQLSVSSDEAYP